MRITAALVTLSFALCSISTAQEPSLAETVAFIQRSLLDDGRELYESTNKISSVHSDGCRLAWTHAEIGNRFSGSVIRTKELNLADLDASQIKGWDTLGVLRVATYNSEPKIRIHSRRYYNNIAKERDAYVNQLELEFQDPRVVDRLAQAFTHAAQLCGAKPTKNPF